MATEQAVGPRRSRGRPPAAPRTQLARWLRARGITVTRLSQELAKHAAERGIGSPTLDELSNATVCRTRPSAIVMLLVRDATGGDIDLEHWVSDFHDQADPAANRKNKKGVDK